MPPNSFGNLRWTIQIAALSGTHPDKLISRTQQGIMTSDVIISSSPDLLLTARMFPKDALTVGGVHLSTSKKLRTVG